MRGLIWSLQMLCAFGLIHTKQQFVSRISQSTSTCQSSLLLATVVEDLRLENVEKQTISFSSNNGMEKHNDDDDVPTSLLSFSFEELSQRLGGTGKAKACWDCLRIGIDPTWYYNSGAADYNQGDCISSNCDKENAGHILKGWSRQQVKERLEKTNTRGSATNLGKKTQQLLQEIGGGAIEEEIAKLSQISISPDGTTKLLLQLVSDGLEVETVIIPWDDRGKSTLCVSSQVGCKQGCTFCSTGRMGRLRSLTTAEILAQMYWANKIQRLLPEQQRDIHNMENRIQLHPIDNCVFMGMGEPADNIPAVVKAATMMADGNLFQLAPRRITISTVAPNPNVFQQLAEAPVVLAWSVHSSRDEIRRQLVPTTKYNMEELRDGLLTTLRGRSKRLRNTMLEVTLLDEINDSPEDAQHLADFCRPFCKGPDAVKGIKLTVNLIPWNDISASFGPASGYRQPKKSRVEAYKKVLEDEGILCFVRTTRGDEENAACGMLSTKKRKRDMEDTTSASTK